MNIVRRITDLLASRARIYETRRALSRLSDRSLADLGIERDLIPDVATMASGHGENGVSLAMISAMAAQALAAREATTRSGDSRLAGLLGTPKRARLATAD